LPPEFVETQSAPPLEAANTTEQSESHAIERQFWVDAVAVHVWPLFVDLNIRPLATVANITVPSSD
jgi:hypothetical protein